MSIRENIIDEFNPEAVFWRLFYQAQPFRPLVRDHLANGRECSFEQRPSVNVGSSSRVFGLFVVHVGVKFSPDLSFF